ncbi:carbohydrate ABC transporter permease [Planctomonas psychrotolerans]|uniref:carbohydrate ABC transporter permease n=1 Tax=Planctomonas psychrotolerans TaxID=2528712 RepID=UPI001D0D1714|nr:sugar ABC transporter permease [Planctomonas psychrotolerans]
MNAPTLPSKRREVEAGSRSESTSKRRRLMPSGYLWILPAMVLCVGIIYYSVGYTGYISTLEWDGSSPVQRSVGADNYAQLFRDPIFWQAIRNTAVFFVITFAVQTALGILFAAILHSNVRLKVVYKVIIFVPVVLAPSIMAPSFRQIFGANGQLNQVLEAVGLDFLAHPWLADSATALPTLMLITVWHWTGLTFILYFAAMGQVEPEVLEAARIDGAGNLRTLWSIVLPSVRGTTIAILMLSIIGALKTFDIPYLITLGGPNYSTEFLGTYIYRQSIPLANVGYGAALSIILLVLALAFAITVNVRSQRKES